MNIEYSKKRLFEFVEICREDRNIYAEVITSSKTARVGFYTIKDGRVLCLNTIIKALRGADGENVDALLDSLNRQIQKTPIAEWRTPIQYRGDGDIPAHILRPIFLTLQKLGLPVSETLGEFYSRLDFYHF